TASRRSRRGRRDAIVDRAHERQENGLRVVLLGERLRDRADDLSADVPIGRERGERRVAPELAANRHALRAVERSDVTASAKLRLERVRDLIRSRVALGHALDDDGADRGLRYGLSDERRAPKRVRRAAANECEREPSHPFASIDKKTTPGVARGLGRRGERASTGVADLPRGRGTRQALK